MFHDPAGVCIPNAAAAPAARPCVRHVWRRVRNAALKSRALANGSMEGARGHKSPDGEGALGMTGRFPVV